jgi:transglutaminase-like putative cysteine protease
MLLSVKATATYELSAETFLLVMVEPHAEAPDHQVKDARFVTSPTTHSVSAKDFQGNIQRRIVAPAGLFRYEYTATIEADPNETVPPEAVENPAKDLSPEALVYTLPSRYCQSDLLARMARDEFGKIPSGGARVRAIYEWVRSHVEYSYGTTDSKTSAFDTATERVGVCRDFAHLVIAFCRGLDIPARYASGYALGLEPQDFHGFAQVYLGGAWHNVDATSEALRPALVPIAVGRDAADVAMTTIWGISTVLEQTVQVKEVES